MRIFALLVALLLTCVRFADLSEYHYNPPQTPLHVGLGPQTPNLRESYANPQATARHYAPAAPSSYVLKANAVAQNFGHTGTVHIARQLPTGAAAQGAHGSMPPHYQNSNGANQVNHYNQAPGIAAAVDSYHYPQPGQQYYTPNVNPLTQQQQPHKPVYINLQQPQQQYNQQSYAHSQPYQQQFLGGTSFGGGGAGSFGAAGHAVRATIGTGQTLPLNGKYVSQSEAGQLSSYQHQQNPVGDTRPFARQITTCQPGGQCQSVTLGPGQADQRHQHTVALTRAKTQPASDKCRLIKEANIAQEIANQYGAGTRQTGNSNAGSSLAGSSSADGSYAGSSYAGGSYTGGLNTGGFYAGSSSYNQAASGAYGGDALGVGTSNGGPSYGVNFAGGSHSHHDPNNPHHASGLTRPKNRRLFPYSEVVLPIDPYN